MQRWASLDLEHSKGRHDFRNQFSSVRENCEFRFGICILRKKKNGQVCILRSLMHDPWGSHSPEIESRTRIQMMETKFAWKCQFLARQYFLIGGARSIPKYSAGTLQASRVPPPHIWHLEMRELPMWWNQFHMNMDICMTRCFHVGCARACPAVSSAGWAGGLSRDSRSTPWRKFRANMSIPSQKFLLIWCPPRVSRSPRRTFRWSPWSSPTHLTLIGRTAASWLPRRCTWIEIR